jgi:hypothetical protein
VTELKLTTHFFPYSTSVPYKKKKRGCPTGANIMILGAVFITPPCAGLINGTKNLHSCNVGIINDRKLKSTTMV